MTPESPIWEFRHSWTEIIDPPTALSDAPDGGSECSASCGSEMTSISRRILREAAQQPSVKHSSYTQMYLGTSASLRATSAQRLKAALFTKVITERKENQMQQETKKRRNHNVKLWLSDAENFPDLAGFLTLDQEPQPSSPTDITAAIDAVPHGKACNSSPRIAPESPMSCAVVYDHVEPVEPVAPLQLEIPHVAAQRKSPVQAPKLEIPFPQMDSGAEKSLQETREAAAEVAESRDTFKEENTAASAQDAIFADGGQERLEQGEQVGVKVGCFPSLLRCIPSFRSASHSKTPSGPSASGSVCDSDGLSAAKTSDGGEEEIKRKDPARAAIFSKTPSLRTNLLSLSAATTPSQQRAPASWARGVEGVESVEAEVEVEVKERNGQRRKVSAAIVHGPPSGLTPAPFLINCQDGTPSRRDSRASPAGRSIPSTPGELAKPGGAWGGGAARVLQYA